MNTIARVALDVPLRSLYDYLCDSDTAVGCRVRVPFGRSTRIGLVTALADQSELPADKLKRVISVLDQQPLINAELATLLNWASRYYHHPVGEVWFSALPGRLRQGEAATLQPQERWRLTSLGKNSPPAPRAARQLALWKSLQQAACSARQLDEQFERWRPAMRELRKKELVEIEHHFDDWSGPGDESPLTLNAEQQRAVEHISASLGQFGCFLLEGVTGSGKTEVYLQLSKQLINAGKQVLLLVPEIGLTSQTVNRFRNRFDCPVVLLHSGLSELQRQNGWLLAASGDAKIVIGTRSALFTPLRNAGMIIVDEEHDSSYKQQEGFRYNARDLAAVRARELGVPLLLGSATPTLESFHAASGNQFHHLVLAKRAGGQSMPQLRVVDARHQRTQGLLCAALRERVEEQLQLNQQVLLFLNRRGYAPVLICDDCGTLIECERCDSAFTYHQQRNLLACHHCGNERPVPRHCPDCNQGTLITLGAGTERVEETLAELFPDYPVLRIDRDSTRRKGAFDEQLKQINSGEARLLLGTQMLAKGHHFPQVTLVGILDSDQSLFATDFRAIEKLTQLIYQVAGRCGRGEQPGEVVIQTHQPHHPLWNQLLTSSYSDLVPELLAERQLTAFPPYSYLALIRAEAPSQETATQALGQLVETVPTIPNVEWWGPVRAPKPKRAGQFRAQLLLQSQSRSRLHEQLEQAINLLESPAMRKIRWSVDVDPIDLY
ncbi:MAG TPA: primosomal protein N' [Gammaproteobacteria bacterium]|nr:primosomal protein N' [Gammaproteobacteria bacterium]